MSWQADVLAEVLDQALARLDTHPPRRSEETSAGTCWEIADTLDSTLDWMVA